MIKVRKPGIPIIMILLLLMTATAASPALAWNDCPKGKVNCSHPCRDYVDSNGNSICDRSESSAVVSGEIDDYEDISGSAGSDADSGTAVSDETLQPENDETLPSVTATTDDGAGSGQASGTSGSNEDTSSVEDTEAESIDAADAADSGTAAVGTDSEETSSKDTANTSALLSALLEPQFLVLLLLLVLALVAVRKGFPSWVRLSILTASVGYFGVYLKGCMCSIGVMANLPLVWQGMTAGRYNLWLILFLLPIVFAVFAGRIYCGGVCPFGAVQEFVFMLGSKLGLNQGKTGVDSVSWPKYFKYIFLLAVFVITPLTGIAWWCQIDPFGYLFNLSGTSIAAGILIVLLAASLLVFRPWCQYICPYGAMLGIVAKDASLLSTAGGGPSIVKSTCKNCGRCAKKCPVEAIHKGAINDAECISCGDCIKACKLGAVAL